MTKIMELDLLKELNNLKRFYFPFNKEEIYKNGIYILFEKGETYQNLDRVVRIGTHTGSNNLYNRLIEHFVTENKDRSIFRKNIGRCYLKDDPYIDIWNMDFKLRKTRKQFNNYRDFKKENKLEKRISKHIKENMSFALIEITSKKDRLFYEKKLIGTISSFKEFKKSPNWLGNYSPNNKIKESGLWQVQGLYKNKFTNKEYNNFKIKLKKQHLK